MDLNLMDDELIARLLVSSSPEGILIASSDGEILSVNNSLVSMFGYEAREELVGKQVEVLIPPKYSKVHKAHRKEYVDDPQKRKMGIGKILYGERKDGSVFPVEIGLNYLKKEEVVYVSGMVTDITGRVRIENELKELNSRLESKVAERTTELEQALLELQETYLDLEEQYQRIKLAEDELNDALKKERELGELKSRFVSTASHEFRTPLSTILSSNTLVEKYLEKEQLNNPDKIFKHIKKITRTVRNMNNILNDFLSLGKLEEGKTPIKIEEFDFIELLKETIEEIDPLMKKGQKVNMVHKGDGSRVQLDRKIMHDVLLNLISNASKYSEEGKQITIESYLSKERFGFYVQDEGIGIPEDDQVHMFDRFFRAKNVDAIQGTGLGLNIVKKYLELMNGTITFESEPEKGTRFIVDINMKYVNDEH